MRAETLNRRPFPRPYQATKLYTHFHGGFWLGAYWRLQARSETAHNFYHHKRKTPVSCGEVSMSRESKTQAKSEETTPEEFSVTLSGVADQIITSACERTKVQITIKGADDLYKEIRLPNVLSDGNGRSVALVQGAEVEITIRLKAQDEGAIRAA
jgi:hypothetical protein